MPALLLAAVVLVGVAARAQQLPPGLNLPPGVSIEQLMQMQQSGGAGRSGTAAVPDFPAATTVQPETQGRTPAARSRLELIQSQRAGTLLRLFGYGVLGVGRPVTITQAGGVQDNYVLGPGDEIIVSLRGQENTEARVQVGRDGRVSLARLNPIPAAGRTFGSFREDLQSAVRRGYVATEAFVSVGRLRQISVLVSGEVNTPGQRVVPALASAVDAILLSGGVRRAGSLRHVRLLRGGREYPLDLYNVVSGRGNGRGDMTLMDGDRIVVPLLGPTVAISGLVRQQGIFELAAGQRGISVADLIALAGGEEISGLYRMSVLRVDADGRSSLIELRDRSAILRDSDILFMQLGVEQTVNRATLSGGLPLAGTFPINEGTKLSSVLRQPGAIGQNPYTLFGIISRRDRRTSLRTLVAFTPMAVQNGAEDMALQTDDIVRPLTVEEHQLLVTVMSQYQSRRKAEDDALRSPISSSDSMASGSQETPNGMRPNGQEQPGQNPNTPIAPIAPNGPYGAPNASNEGRQPAATVGTSGGTAAAAIANASNTAEAANRPISSQDAIFDTENRSPTATPLNQNETRNFQDQRVQNVGYASNLTATTFNQIAQQLSVDPIVLVNFLSDHQTTIDGAVRGPGSYFVGPTTALADLMLAAGGAQTWADISAVELISTIVDPTSGKSLTRVEKLAGNAAFASYFVKPHDNFRFNRVFTDTDVGTITLQGEVRFAGSYKLTRGERLSEVLMRAGGLTNSAYPYGTIFLRKSVAALEQDSFLRAAREAEDQLVIAMTRVGSSRLDPSAFSAMQGFVNELRTQKALGRIAIQADPSVLAANPGIDVMLEAGDVIYVPPRPSTISVLGQVMQPGSYPYRPGASVADYVGRAGGYNSLSDSSEVFIVYPDGSARKVETSWLRFQSIASLPPGSSIVVPRDLSPLDLRQTVIDVGQLFSQFVVSIASIAVLTNN